MVLGAHLTQTMLWPLPEAQSSPPWGTGRALDPSKVGLCRTPGG